MIAQPFIGVDDAKDWIDLFHLPTARRDRIAKTKQALARLARRAVGCEPAGTIAVSVPVTSVKLVSIPG